MKSLKTIICGGALACLAVSPVVASASSKAGHEVHELAVDTAVSTHLEALGAELDPHFFSQNVTRNEGVKAEDWDSVVVRRIELMGLHRLRIMVLPSWIEPVNDNSDPNVACMERFTFDSAEMQSLYRELDTAERLGLRVNLTMWGAQLGHFIAGSNAGDWCVSPFDFDEWAENFSVLVKHLIVDKGYSCIKEITPINEPDWAMKIGSNGVTAPTEHYMAMCKVLNARFRRDGIRHLVKFSLSDNSDGGTGTHAYLKACAEGLQSEADVLNSHVYLFGYETPNSKIYDWERENCRIAATAGHRHFVGEFGSNQCVDATRQRDINLYERGILMARIALCCLNAGASGLSYWSLIDQYYYHKAGYGEMQQLGMWKSVRKVYEADSLYTNMRTNYEVRPQYYAYGLLTNHMRPGAEVHAIDTGDEFCAASAVRNPDGRWVYVFANAGKSDIEVRLNNALASERGKRYDVYRYTRNGLPADDSMISADSRVLRRLALTIGGESVVVIAGR